MPSIPYWYDELAARGRMESVIRCVRLVMLEMFLKAGSLGIVLLRRKNTCSRRPFSSDMTLGVISRTCPS